MEDSALESYEPWSHSQALKQVILPVEGVSIKEKFELHCKPTCKTRRVKAKGALLVLAWNFLAASVFWYTVTFYFERGLLTTGAVLAAITLPIAGWLADAYVGRYRVIYYSSLILWAVTIINTTNTVIQELVKGHDHINTVVAQIVLGAMGIGIGGFLSTIIQFGIDQLYDASTDEISAFIMWYIWTSGCPPFIMNLTSYIQQNYHYFNLFGHLLSCASLSLMLVSTFCCNNWLIKEPISQNPFKLIYRVSKYAIKTKYPRNRSAFTYCEDEVISRIDYGKSKYGGPFTTEQVEDVKMFYKLLPMVLFGGMLVGEAMAMYLLIHYIKSQFVLPNNNEETQSMTNKTISNIIPCSVPVLILINEIVLYPIFQRSCSCLTSLYKFFIGEVMQIATFLALLTFETLSRKTHLETNGHNATLSCVFYRDQTLATSFNYNWIAIPDFLFVLSVTLVTAGGLEFIFAQVPYSMRGVILGLAFCSAVPILGLNVIVIIALQQKLTKWSSGVTSCGFWYALGHFIICIFVSVVSAIVKMKYKRRIREDVLPNEQFHAERYYSNHGNS